MPKRIFTWVILVINVGFLAWVIGGGISAGNSACQPGYQDACDAGTAIGVGLIIGLWVAVDFILGILWLITRPKRRQCPVCGKDVKKNRTVCKCGFDFARAAQQQYGQYGPPQQQYGQPLPDNRSGGTGITNS